MSLFQRSFYGEDPSLTIFRVLDDLATYSRAAESSPCNTRQARHRVFNPRFDVRETESAFELHGELPGIERENLNIEFTEPQTLVVRGRVSRSYSSGTPPSAPVEDSQTTKSVTEGTEQTESTSTEVTHQASVADEETEVAKEKGEAVAAPAQPKAQPSPPKERYWHQERSTGEFRRTFKFQTRVDEDAVSATLERGILHVTVPKATKHETRRINID